MDECVGHDSEWIVRHLTGASEADPAILEDLENRASSPEFFAAVRPTPGGLELLAALREARTPCAVVSSGLRAYIEGCLAAWGASVELIVAGDGRRGSLDAESDPLG